MVHKLLTLIYAFLATAACMTSVTVVPVSVVWANFWVYVVFTLWIIPAAVAALITIFLGIAILGVIGIGVFGGAAAAADGLSNIGRNNPSDRLRRKLSKRRIH